MFEGSPIFLTKVYILKLGHIATLLILLKFSNW